MSRFRRRGGGIRWELEPFEVQLLGQLRAGLDATLAEAGPTDPVVRRLFPPAVSEDEEADAELRRLMRDDLLEGRRRGLEALLTILERAEPHRGERLRVELADDEPMLVLGVLNDLRLALGARLGIEQLDRERLREDDPEVATLAVMDHLAWIQESLLRILDPASVGHHDDEDPAAPE